MEEIVKRLAGDKTNFVFLGEAGSGKSEIAINFARYLTELGEKPVHFFDMDMTKPLFRSRDVMEKIENLGITFHRQEQFYDAPTMVGGVNRHLGDDNCHVVMDVGGNEMGARAVGGYAPKINKDNTVVYYVLNAYRPWSANIEGIDLTLSLILGISHVQLGQVHMISNPNIGTTTTKEEFLDGCRKMAEMVGPYEKVDFTCVMEALYEEVKDGMKMPLLPLKLYLTYPWNKDIDDDPSQSEFNQN